jgi:hypothetical protein
VLAVACKAGEQVFCLNKTDDNMFGGFDVQAAVKRHGECVVGTGAAEAAAADASPAEQGLHVRRNRLFERSLSLGPNR